MAQDFRARTLLHSEDFDGSEGRMSPHSHPCLLAEDGSGKNQLGYADIALLEGAAESRPAVCTDSYKVLYGRMHRSFARYMADGDSSSDGRSPKRKKPKSSGGVGAAGAAGAAGGSDNGSASAGNASKFARAQRMWAALKSGISPGVRESLRPGHYHQRISQLKLICLRTLMGEGCAFQEDGGPPPTSTLPTRLQASSIAYARFTFTMHPFQVYPNNN